MGLDLLTAMQWGTCALLHVECCVYILDHQQKVQKALQEMDAEISAIQTLKNDPLTCWWNSVGPSWRWAVLILAGIATSLVVIHVFLLWPLFTGTHSLGQVLGHHLAGSGLTRPGHVQACTGYCSGHDCGAS